jgi:predicted metalloprotease with PDZ domain
MIDSLSKLVREAGAMYASRHDNTYHFLLGLSDSEEGNGLEHHQSSDNRTPEHAFSDESFAPLVSDLLPHEYTHSWNGKYRRPIGLATPDYATLMQGSLLWVYEAMTQYLGEVLSVRSGFATPEQFREALAFSAANLDVKAGRTWRDLEDTAVASSDRREHRLFPDGASRLPRRRKNSRAEACRRNTGCARRNPQAAGKVMTVIAT